MEFCEFCGNILNDDGRCPWADCPHNAILDVMSAAEAADKQTTTTTTTDAAQNGGTYLNHYYRWRSSLWPFSAIAGASLIMLSSNLCRHP